MMRLLPETGMYRYALCMTRCSRWTQEIRVREGREPHLCSIGETSSAVQDAVPDKCQGIDRLAEDDPREDVPNSSKHCCVPCEEARQSSIPDCQYCGQGEPQPNPHLQRPSCHLKSRHPQDTSTLIPM